MSGNFRKIRPSFGDSSGTPSQSTPESTGPDPRRNRGGEKENAEGSSSSFSKRRRVPESVTRNACLNCKKARAKCDGKKPCKRCASRVEAGDCVYEIHVKHAKEELVRQIKDLRTNEHLNEQILNALSLNEKVPGILEKLKAGDRKEDIVEWLGRSPIAEEETLSPRESHHSGFETEDQEMIGVPGSFRWTTVVSLAVVDHLFQLYFAWIHPVHTLFSEGHFVESYHNHSEFWCSSVLVNAICAMACHLHTNMDGDDAEYYEHLAGEFRDAVRKGLDPNDRSITTAQTFAVFFLVDCASGKALRATSYLQIATANLSELLEETYSDVVGNIVWRNTVRGVRALNIEWAQMTFQVPPIVLSADYVGIEKDDDSIDELGWYCYRFKEDKHLDGRPGLLATTNREKAKLLSIVQETATMLYSRRPPHISAHRIMQQYKKYSRWREELPAVIGDTSIRSEVLPHILSLLISYECSVVQLLRPLLTLENFPSQMVEERIWRHAQRGLFLVAEQHRSEYTCRYQSVLQMLAVLHLTDLVARFFPGGYGGDGEDGPGAIQLGMDVLQQSKIGFGFPVASTYRELLRLTALKLSIRLQPEIGSMQQSAQKTYGMDDFINACTRPTYAQPITEIHLRYLPSLSADWAANGASHGWPAAGARSLRSPTAEERGAQSLMQISNLINPS